MKAIRLYDWEDTERQHCLAEVEVLRVDDYTQNGKRRQYLWSGGDEEFNYVLYPDFGTAYPEFDNLLQQQRYARRYLYEAVE